MIDPVCRPTATCPGSEQSTSVVAGSVVAGSVVTDSVVDATASCAATSVAGAPDSPLPHAAAAMANTASVAACLTICVRFMVAVPPPVPNRSEPDLHRSRRHLSARIAPPFVHEVSGDQRWLRWLKALSCKVDPMTHAGIGHRTSGGRTRAAI